MSDGGHARSQNEGNGSLVERKKVCCAGMSSRRRHRHRCLFAACDRTDADNKLTLLPRNREKRSAILLGPGGWRLPRSPEEIERWEQVLSVNRAFVCQQHLQTSALEKVGCSFVSTVSMMRE